MLIYWYLLWPLAVIAWRPPILTTSDSLPTVNMQLTSTFVNRLESGSRLDCQNAMLELCVMLDHGNRPPLIELGIPALIRLLQDKDDLTRSLSVEVLGRLGQAAQPAIPALVRVLGDREGCAGLVAVGVLADFGEVSVPALVEALKDKDPIVRQLAARSLGRMGQRGRAALPALRQAMKSENVDVVRRSIARAIKEIPDWPRRREQFRLDRR
jgi:hypothetical protein